MPVDINLHSYDNLPLEELEQRRSRFEFEGFSVGGDEVKVVNRYFKGGYYLVKPEILEYFTYQDRITIGDAQQITFIKALNALAVSLAIEKRKHPAEECRPRYLDQDLPLQFN